MKDSVFEHIERNCQTLKLDFSSVELANLFEELNWDESQMTAIEQVFNYLSQKKQQQVIQTLLKLSHLPAKSPKTFENFDFTRIKGKDIDKLKNLPSLAPIYAHKNIAFIGPAGIGKTHLAQAFGYECCQRGIKTYFIKMSELKDKFTTARRTGKEAAILNGLVRPSCLIIDEVGHCDFNKDNTRMFFDMIDRRYNKEGCYNTIFTSNKYPAQWRSDFSDDGSLLLALDRVFDNAVVFNLKGDGYRGKNLETVILQAEHFKAPGSSEIPPNLK